MAQEFLDYSDVCAAGEEVGCEGVAEDVGVDVPESCCLCAAFDDLPDGDAFEWASGFAEEESSFVSAVGAREDWACVVEVVDDGLCCGFAYRTRRCLSPLPVTMTSAESAWKLRSSSVAASDARRPQA